MNRPTILCNSCIWATKQNLLFFVKFAFRESEEVAPLIGSQNNVVKISLKGM